MGAPSQQKRSSPALCRARLLCCSEQRGSDPAAGARFAGTRLGHPALPRLLLSLGADRRRAAARRSKDLPAQTGTVPNIHKRVLSGDITANAGMVEASCPRSGHLHATG